MDSPLPYVTAALLCEKVLEEKNGTLSIIHIADRMSFRLQGLPPGFKPAAAISGLVCLKSGPVTGDHKVNVVIEKPGGERKEVLSFAVNFQGKDHGQNLILNITLGIDEEGLYWFDVLFDQRLLTRIPLMVIQEEEPLQPAKKT